MTVKPSPTRESGAADAFAAYSFDFIRETGVLWALNRYLFHPRGFAFALTYDDHDPDTGAPIGEPNGWELLGEGGEPWQFSEADDDRLFQDFEAFIVAHKAEP